MPPYLRYATEKQAEIVAFIRRLVECESPSDSPAAVNRCVDLLVEETSDIASAELIPAEGFGNHVRLEFKLSGGGDSQLLALGHSDTVWPLGTLASMPFREADRRLWGPGVLDMKGGLTFFIYAMRALRDLDIPVPHKVALLVVSDEEVGSPSSRPVTEAQAKLSQSVLVLEPGTGLTGKLKTARKGVGGYSLFVEGKAAHAGVDFPDGANAIIEAARQVLRIAEFTDLANGTTVNPGLISGGTRTNVVAAQARVDVDIRVARLGDARLLDEKFRALQPVDQRCTLRIEGGLNRPPMERTPAIEALFFQARETGAAIGVAVEESSTGGGSDGNFTAALGVPTLDGLGAVGEGAHAANESILLDRIADRVALLAGLVSGRL
jgi:glutamate carboxypeptidase